jgi:hypothetical protein
MPASSKTTYPEALNCVIESPAWPDGLKPMTRYSRVHDDHDGEFTGTLDVVFSDDGDAWVSITGGEGGSSTRVRNALVALAEAIRRENEERPIRQPKDLTAALLQPGLFEDEPCPT